MAFLRGVGLSGAVVPRLPGPRRCGAAGRIVVACMTRHGGAERPHPPRREEALNRLTPPAMTVRSRDSPAREAVGAAFWFSANRLAPSTSYRARITRCSHGTTVFK